MGEGGGGGGGRGGEWCARGSVFETSIGNDTNRALSESVGSLEDLEQVNFCVTGSPEPRLC